MHANTGRRLDGVWVYYDRIIDSKGNPKGTCKGCGLVLSGIVSRLWRHVDECKLLVQAGLVDPPMLSEGSSMGSSMGEDSQSSGSSGRKRSLQTMLMPVVTDRTTKNKLDEAVGAE
jgi:hypothetical protein